MSQNLFAFVGKAQRGHVLNVATQLPRFDLIFGDESHKTTTDHLENVAYVYQQNIPPLQISLLLTPLEILIG
jgi:hypothetical protein